VIKKKIVITGGHLSPAISVIKQLQKDPKWEIYFFGRRYESEGESVLSAEAKIIPEMGIKFIPIAAGKIQRKFTKYTIPAILRLPLGFIQSFWQLFKIKPDVILSFGGYMSVPVVINGWILRIPSLTHEQTTVVGLGTKINQYFVNKIAVSWPELSWNFPNLKVVFTGNPVNKDFLQSDEKIWTNTGFDNKKPTIVITGGRQGSHAINETMAESIDILTGKYNIFHQVGPSERTGDFEKLNAIRDQLPAKKKISLIVKKYLYGKEWGTILNHADLVITRSGINTLTELAILGKPMLLIPLPWLYNNEQVNNAILFKKWGLAEIILQKDLTVDNLLNKIESIFTDIDKFKVALSKFKKVIKKDAAQKIVIELEKLC